KSPARYAETRETRRELPYEAMLASGRTHWRVGDRVRVYRTQSGGAAVVDADEEAEGSAAADPRDYDVDHYGCVLRDNFATRLARAIDPADFSAIFSDPEQFSLFPPAFSAMRPILRQRGHPAEIPV
ncbi:MAG: DNA polymerase II, partial [Gemmatimonadetes bacterium]|nr:DNA polymerase II [Gemmatimonadota bacterium]